MFAGVGLFSGDSGQTYLLVWSDANDVPTDSVKEKVGPVRKDCIFLWDIVIFLLLSNK